MLYAEGIGDDSVNNCRQDERGRWVCDEAQSVGAAPPFWQSVDHWNFPEAVKSSSSPWGTFKRAYAYPRESTCPECVGTPVGAAEVAKGATLGVALAVGVALFYFIYKG